jgi:FkbM family methyltransferase
VGLLKEVFLDRWYECEAKPPADATMVDIGANIAAASLYWAAVSPSLRIHADEPNPSALDTLRQDPEANGLRNRMAVFPEAVGAGAGKLDLWVDIPTELSTGYLDHSPVEGGRRISVPMVGMDDVWRRLDQREVWLWKIDTEGAEANIFEGAPARPVERHPDRDRGVPRQHLSKGIGEMSRVLDAAGFHWRERVHPWDEGIIYGHRAKTCGHGTVGTAPPVVGDAALGEAAVEPAPRGEELERTQEEVIQSDQKSSSPTPGRPVVPRSALGRVASRVPTALLCCDRAC